MVDFNQVFHEDYSHIVKKVNEKINESFRDKIKRLYHYYFKHHINVTDFEFCTFCKLAYSNDGVMQEFIDESLNKKYEIINFINIDDGLQFYVIKSKMTKDIIIVFRGTDEWKDWLTNIQIMNRKRQFESAEAYLNVLLEEYLEYQIYFCGHSLGGALSQVMYLKYSTFTKIKLKKAVTFNSAGVRMKNELAYPSLPITNYIIESDIVGSSTGYHYGKVLFLKSKKKAQSSSLLSLYTHSLDQFIFNKEGKLINENLLELV